MNPVTGSIQSLLLGLSTGTYCAMYCAPVLLPFLTGRNEVSVKKTARLTSLFLAGRLLTYCVMGIIFATAGLLLSRTFNPVFVRRLSVIAYILCGFVLLYDSLRTKTGTTERRCFRMNVVVSKNMRDAVASVLAGLTVGLHICPAYWATLLLCADSASVPASILYFSSFYAGTIPFFLPVLGLPFAVRKIPMLKRIAQITQALIAGYFIIFAGVIPLFFYS